MCVHPALLGLLWSRYTGIACKSLSCFCPDRFVRSQRAGPLNATRRAATTAIPLCWPSCSRSTMPSSARRPAPRPASVRSSLCPERPRLANTYRYIAGCAWQAFMCIVSSPSNGHPKRTRITNWPAQELTRTALCADI